MAWHRTTDDRFKESRSPETGNLPASVYPGFPVAGWLPIFVGMKRAGIKEKIGLLAVLALVGLLFLRFAWPLAPASRETGSPDPQNVNLALRRTAHLLLRAAGDSTSRIPPVEQLNAHEWIVQLNDSFDYERLPALLQESFERRGIPNDYNVIVLDCATSQVQLGYSFQDFKENPNAGVACGGRERESGCYQLKVTFGKPGSPRSTPVWPALALTFSALGGLGFLLWRQRRRRNDGASVEKEEPLSDRIAFGQSSFSPANQVLIAGGVRHTLTYREAKLLQLFVAHPNQVLERDAILQQVWADEGVLVGRSIDVFVSRLRKLLRNDPSVKIVAVHGVGYRMEVA